MSPSFPAGRSRRPSSPLPPITPIPCMPRRDSKSLRGAEGRARVSTNGWIQVFGSEGDWILVQYDITDTHNRIGYIEKDALPDGTVVPRN